MLADKAGVVIEYNSGGNHEDTSKRDRLRSAMTRAAEWYAGNIKDSAAYAYALKRGLTDESIQTWSLGFAPDAWRDLLEAFTAEGFTIPELLAAGHEQCSNAVARYLECKDKNVFPASYADEVILMDAPAWMKPNEEV